MNSAVSMDTETDSDPQSDFETLTEEPHQGPAHEQTRDWRSDLAVLSPTYKQRNEDFRKLFKQLPDSECLIVDYSCALQQDILMQGRLYLSENWICFHSNILRWKTLLTVRLKDISSMTKEKTAFLIPNAIQLCTGNEKAWHFLTSFWTRDRTYMMMFGLWKNALLEKPLCPKVLWHFVHQCYGSELGKFSELGMFSEDEDFVPLDEDFHGKAFPPGASNSVVASVIAAADSALPYNTPPGKKLIFLTGDEELMPLPLSDNRSSEPSSHAHLPLLNFHDNKDRPTELSNSSDDEGEVQAFLGDLNGRQYINKVYKFSVDKMYDILFTESQFMKDFLEQRRFSDVVYQPWSEEEAGNQTREIKYTISLTNPLAPKTATVTETQTLYKDSQKSTCYIVDAEVITHDVRYSDHFYTLKRYTLTRVAENKCCLRVSTELRYKKQLRWWIKDLIEKNLRSNLDEYFRHLELELNKESVLTESHPQSPGAEALRRRKRPLVHLRPARTDEALSPMTTPEEEDEVTEHVAGSTQTRHIPDPVPGGFALYSVSKLLLIISFVLVLLVFLSIVFYKVWMLEYTTQSLYTQDLPVQESKPPQTQRHYHDDGLQK